MTLAIPDGAVLLPGVSRALLEAGYTLSWTTDPFYDDERGAGAWPAKGGTYFA